MIEANKKYSQLGFVLLLFLGFVAVLTIAVILFVSYGVFTGQLSSTEVLAGVKIPPRQHAEVAKIAGLNPNERITFFYSASMTPAGDGNLVTDQRIASYSVDGSGKWIDDVPLVDVASADIMRGETWVDDSVITVYRRDGTSVILYASRENNGDLRMFKAIQSAIKQNAG